jgi:hypothetical protein
MTQLRYFMFLMSSYPGKRPPSVSDISTRNRSCTRGYLAMQKKRVLMRAASEPTAAKTGVINS